MSKMNQCPYLPEGWLESMKEKLTKKVHFGAEKAEKHDFIPYTTKDGDWTTAVINWPTINWWTNGFWGGEMWQMYLMTGDRYFRDAAVRGEEMMDKALRNFKALSHDVGMMWLIQSGVRHALEGNQESWDRAYFAASMLAARFNPNGFLRAWNGEGREGWAIIDCMMNLPLLHWASRQMKDPRYSMMATMHADTAMKYFVRPDGSVNHMVSFDPVTGEYLDNPYGQGYESGSSWSRGQAWALYGFVLSYLMTGKQEHLDTAVRVANYFIACVQETDWIPACDFRAPLSGEIVDNAAGSIAACGLLELAKCLPEYQQKTYVSAACKMLMAMDETCADWTEAQPAILTKCSVAYHADVHHVTMNYADYFFVEAINKLLGCPMLFWKPDAAELKE